jgi:hypothetical protein
MQKLYHGITLALGLCFITAALSPESFIFIREDHDCCGDGCPVCLQIQGSALFSGNLRSAAFSPRPALRPLLTEAVVSKSPVAGCAPISPVIQKIKMNL